MKNNLEITCPTCRQKFKLEQDQMIKVGYNKAIKELKRKLELMEVKG